MASTHLVPNSETLRRSIECLLWEAFDAVDEAEHEYERVIDSRSKATQNLDRIRDLLYDTIENL